MLTTWWTRICGVYCAGTPTTTSTATTKLQHKMEIQALNNSEAGNGGGKACKFLLVYSRHHHHKPPSFMRIGNFDKIDSVVLSCAWDSDSRRPGFPRPNFARERLKIALDGPAKIPQETRQRKKHAVFLSWERSATRRKIHACPIIS